jgi:hypothetical protein
MSAKDIKKPIAAQPGALKRIEQLEATSGAIVTALNKTFTEFNSKQNSIVEAVEAIISVVGVEEVRAAMEARARAQEEARIAAQKKAVEEAVTSGQLKPSTAITPSSYVVGSETRDGKPVGTGRVQVEVSRLADVIREPLLGQAAGFVLKTPDGTEFAIEEVYEIVPQAPTPPAPAPESDENPSTMAPAAELEKFEEELAPTETEV